LRIVNQIGEIAIPEPRKARTDQSLCSFCPESVEMGRVGEYIYAEEFEQDCFTNAVPCGDCFWCMGLFHCLQ